MKNTNETIIALLFGLLLATLVAALFAGLIAYPVMFCWNKVIPKLLHLPAIGFWVSLYLTLLCTLLFGNKFSSSKD